MDDVALPIPSPPNPASAPAEVEDLAQAMLAEDQRRAEEGAWEEEEAATTGSLSSAAGPHEDRPSSSASGGRAPLFMERGRVSPAGMPSMSITIPGSAAATAAASAGSSGGFAGPGSGGVGAAGSSLGSSLGGSLKVNAREFVPGGFASPGLAVSPPTGSAAATAAAAVAAANAAAGLRVAAHEFRPGGPAAGAAGAAAAGAAAAAQAEAEDPLLGQFLSGQLIQASTQVQFWWQQGACKAFDRPAPSEAHAVSRPSCAACTVAHAAPALCRTLAQTLGVYLSMGDDQFGIQTMYLERVGVITTGRLLVGLLIWLLTRFNFSAHAAHKRRGAVMAGHCCSLQGKLLNRIFPLHIFGRPSGTADVQPGHGPAAYSFANF